ncbi:MAG: metal ABC transporter substrate-binding protein, partial [candidate division WOR-3 bacterium]
MKAKVSDRGGFAVGVAALVLMLSACASPQGGKVVVVATLPDLADWARNVGGERVEVVSLLKGGEDPHQFEPKPADALALARAKVLIEVGLGLEEWLSGLIENAGSPKLATLTIADGIDILHDEHEEEGHHSHAHGNPHVWLDPMAARRAVLQLAELLVAVDSGGREYYRQQAEAYVRQLDSATAVLQELAVKAASRRFVAVHESWPYFCRRFGFEAVAAVEPLPGQEPSAKHMAGLVRRMKAEGIGIVVVEPQSPREVAEALARAAGARLVVLCSTTGGLPGTETYLK